MQLSLELWPPHCLRGCLIAYMGAVAHKIADATAADYEARIDWLCRVFGNNADLRSVSFDAMERAVKRLGPRGDGLKMVTLRKRLRFLRAALLYAADRGLLQHAEVPRLPRQLHDDGERGKDYFTPAQFERFLDHVGAQSYHRFFALGFWTGHHSHDLRTYRRWMLDPEYAWKDDNGTVVGRGRYWRRNHKNKRCEGAWMAMEEELRLLSLRWITEHPEWHDQSLVVGRIWVAGKVAARAAAAAGLEYVSPNLGMRRSFATMLASRGYPNELIRHALGHEGEIAIVRHGAQSAPRVETRRPSMASSHYIRPSPDLMRSKFTKTA